jgi:hypothetical protein
MNVNVKIVSAFRLYLEQNSIKPGTKKSYIAQYWFLAGVRSMTPSGRLTAFIELCHSSSRCIIKAWDSIPDEAKNPPNTTQEVTK